MSLITGVPHSVVSGFLQRLRTEKRRKEKTPKTQSNIFISNLAKASLHIQDMHREGRCEYQQVTIVEVILESA